MGYIVMALGGEPTLALIGAGLHFFNHAVSKAQLFTNAAALEKQLGTRDMDRMGGIAARMPVTGGTAAVARTVHRGTAAAGRLLEQAAHHAWPSGRAVSRCSPSSPS